MYDVQTLFLGYERKHPYLGSSAPDLLIVSIGSRPLAGSSTNRAGARDTAKWILTYRVNPYLSAPHHTFPGSRLPFDERAAGGTKNSAKCVAPDATRDCERKRGGGGALALWVQLQHPLTYWFGRSAPFSSGQQGRYYIWGEWKFLRIPPRRPRQPMPSY